MSAHYGDPPVLRPEAASLSRAAARPRLPRIPSRGRMAAPPKLVRLNRSRRGRADFGWPAWARRIILLADELIFMALFCQGFGKRRGRDGQRRKSIEIGTDHLVGQCPDRVVPRSSGRDRSLWE